MAIYDVVVDRVGERPTCSLERTVGIVILRHDNNGSFWIFAVVVIVVIPRRGGVVALHKDGRAQQRTTIATTMSCSTTKEYPHNVNVLVAHFPFQGRREDAFDLGRVYCDPLIFPQVVPLSLLLLSSLPQSLPRTYQASVVSSQKTTAHSNKPPVPSFLLRYPWQRWVPTRRDDQRFCRRRRILPSR